MSLPFTAPEIHSLPDIISAPRFTTYLNAKNGNRADALRLYQWNLEVSSAFIVPLQICEVSVRNSISDAITATHGANWPFEQGFHIRLSNPNKHYNPRRNVQNLRGERTTGKVIAELKFAFWQYMFTSRHDGTIWNPHFRTVFPYADQNKSVQELRRNAFETLKEIRDLRNRIAHHEPIFGRNIQEEYDRIRDVVSWRSDVAAAWVDKIETLTDKIARKP